MTIAALLIMTCPGGAGAVCNAIPGVTTTFRGAQGMADRPFASPGDMVEVSRDYACGADAPNVQSNDVVTVIFTLPGGETHGVVLTSEKTCNELNTSACGGAIPATWECRSGSELSIERRAGVPRLRFSFPAGPNGASIAGPVTIAVTAPTQSVPCTLGAPPTACANVVSPPSSTADEKVVVCIDDLFAPDGGCGATPGETFTHFTGLPPPNDYAALCDPTGECADPEGHCPPPVCEGLTAPLRFTVDTEGNVLVPIDWSGILSTGPVPAARLLRGTLFGIPAFRVGGEDLAVPAASFLRSFTPDGGPIAPIFEPQSGGGLTIFGSADAKRSVLRIARRSREGRACDAAAAEPGRPCNTPIGCEGTECDVECPGGTCALPQSCYAQGSPTGSPCGDGGRCVVGECGPSLFEFRNRVDADGAPLEIDASVCEDGPDDLQCSETLPCAAGECVGHHLTVRDLVPLDGIVETADLYGFVGAEATNQTDLTGDGDELDDALVLMDRHSGSVVSASADGAPVLAVTRVYQPPFSFPAIAAERRILALLESEAGRRGPKHAVGDLDGDGDALDAILRVFRLGDAPAAELLTAGLPLSAVDASPLVNGRSIVVSNGLVFFRTSEPDGTRRVTERIDDPEALALAVHGRFEAIAQGVANEGYLVEVFVHDRVLGTTDPVTIDDSDLFTIVFTTSPVSSADGRFVALEASRFTTIANPDQLAAVQVVVRDRCVANGDVVAGCQPHTELVSVGLDGEAAENYAIGPAISADGRWVTFESWARNLVAGHRDGILNVLARDRRAGVTIRASVDSQGRPGNEFSSGSALSGDGHVVVFVSKASNLVPGDRNGQEDVFTHDLDTGVTERINVSADGGDAHSSDQFPEPFYPPAISADGRLVAFDSPATNLVPGVTSGLRHVYVRDRLAATTELCSVTSRGEPANDGYSARPMISADGQTVFFLSTASNLTGEVGGVATFARHADLTDATADRSGDGIPDDRVLEVFDAQSAADSGIPVITTLGPAGDVAVIDGTAVFARTDSGVAAAPRIVPRGRATADVGILTKWTATSALTDLGCPARSVVMSRDWIAALVDESAVSGGIATGDLNGDEDADDLVVKVRPNQQENGAVDCHEWTNIGQAAESIAISGSLVGFLTPEAAQGDEPINGDRDSDDRIMRLYDARAGGEGLIDIGQSAEDFVLGDGFVAFRTNERAQGDRSLNFDGGESDTSDTDVDDDVLQVYVPEAHCLINTGQVVAACDDEACDPRLPYRAGKNTVTFVTPECSQHGRTRKGCSGSGTDLDHDGSASGRVLQIFNVRRAAHDLCGAASSTTAARSSVTARAAGGALPEQHDVSQQEGTRVLIRLASVESGTCSDTGDACSRDGDCDSGAVCFVPPGLCAGGEHAGIACDRDSQCGESGACRPTAQSRRRLVSPLATAKVGAQVFVAAQPDASAPAGRRLATVTTADTDGDEIPDPFDNCPEVDNPLQADRDGDRVGDACEVMSCPTAPRSDCEVAASRSARLALDVGVRTTRWSWKPDSARPVPGPGTGAEQRDHLLCLYDASQQPQPFMALRALAGTDCSTGHCWQPRGKFGLEYRGSKGRSGQLSKLSFEAGRSSLKRIKAQGAGILPAALALTPGVQVQLIDTRSNRCWHAAFSSPQRNDRDVFKAVSD